MPKLAGNSVFGFHAEIFGQPQPVANADNKASHREIHCVAVHHSMEPNRHSGKSEGLVASGRCVADDWLDLVELLADLALGDFHIETVLQVHPVLCGCAESL